LKTCKLSTEGWMLLRLPCLVGLLSPETPSAAVIAVTESAIVPRSIRL